LKLEPILFLVFEELGAHDFAETLPFGLEEVVDYYVVDLVVHNGCDRDEIVVWRGGAGVRVHAKSFMALDMERGFNEAAGDPEAESLSYEDGILL
jgi:hypothetical protein